MFSTNINIYECMMDILPKEGTMGEQTFFLMKNQTIKLIQSTLIGSSHVNPPCCQGRFCDRKMIGTKTNESCGCFAKHSSVAPVVLQYNVSWNEAKQLKCVIKKERSYRTTDLFIEQPDNGTL